MEPHPDRVNDYNGKKTPTFLLFDCSELEKFRFQILGADHWVQQYPKYPVELRVNHYL